MLITLTTDFGLRDPYVGIMKGVIAGINPAATVIDLTHGIPAQDVMAGALTLRHSIRYFPRGTIHVAVVDPGVGGPRRPLLVEGAGNFFIGPDNGLLSLAVPHETSVRIVRLSNPAAHLRPTSATFHGRDIFAPVSAQVSLGVPLETLGERVDSFSRLAFPKVIHQNNEIIGEIIYIDNFGNLFTNIAEHDLTGQPDECFEIVLGKLRIAGIASNYAAVSAGNPVAIINSWGLLEIAVNRGNAQQRSGAVIGDAVTAIGLT
jgi:S-adenosyl-L-methionine hydrolase (adenosine-forming)